MSEEYRKFLEGEINRLENEILQQGKLIERIDAFRSVLANQGFPVRSLDSYIEYWKENQSRFEKMLSTLLKELDTFRNC